MNCIIYAGKSKVVSREIANVYHYRVPSHCGNLKEKGSEFYMKVCSN